MKRAILASIGYFLWILSLAILIVILCRPLFSWSLTTIDTMDLIGLSKQQVEDNYTVLLHYLLNPFSQQLAMPDIPVSAQGAFHFAEVKNLFICTEIVAVITSISSVYFFKTLKQPAMMYMANIWRYLRYLPVVVISLLAVSFNYWFVLFHKVFFHNDAWLFDASTDPIILVLPESFFMACFIVAFVIVEGGIIWLARVYKQKCQLD